MKKVEYKCNMCNQVKHVGCLMSFYWESGIIPQRYTLRSDLDISDSHICDECINVIVSFSEE